LRLARREGSRRRSARSTLVARCARSKRYSAMASRWSASDRADRCLSACGGLSRRRCGVSSFVLFAVKGAGASRPFQADRAAARPGTIVLTAMTASLVVLSGRLRRQPGLRATATIDRAQIGAAIPAGTDSSAWCIGCSVMLPALVAASLGNVPSSSSPRRKDAALSQVAARPAGARRPGGHPGAFGSKGRSGTSCGAT